MRSPRSGSLLALGLVALSFVALARCTSARAAPVPPAAAVALNVITAPAASDSVVYLVHWDAVSDAGGAASGYVDTVTAAGQPVHIWAGAGLVDTVRLAVPAPGSALAMTACVRATRRGLSSAPACVAWTLRTPDAPPPAPAPSVDTASAAPPAPDSVTADSAPVAAPLQLPVGAPIQVPAAITPLPATSAWSASSPHASWARWAYTDFYYQYHPADSSRPLLATRYDAEMSGCGTCWRALNATMATRPYLLFWQVYTDTGGASSANHIAYQDLVTWVAAHGFAAESAFLHTDTGAVADSAHRIRFFSWSDWKFSLNPADPGFRAYQLARVRSAAAAGASGVFYDAFGRGGMAGSFRSREAMRAMGDTAWQAKDTLWYQGQIIAALAAERDSVRPAQLVVNTASYETPWDSAVVVAAGGAQFELTLNPLAGSLAMQNLHWYEHMTATSATYLEAVASPLWTDPPPKTLTPGNYATPHDRYEVAVYAGYLLARDAAGHLYLNFDNGWSQSPATHWLPLYQVDVGQPLAPRTNVQGGVDATGHKWSVQTRALAHAFVVYRSIGEWVTPDYSDSAAVRFPLSTPMRILLADGVASAPLDTLTLGAGEAAILVRP